MSWETGIAPSEFLDIPGLIEATQVARVIRREQEQKQQAMQRARGR
jgi:hypothetical protein